METITNYPEANPGSAARCARQFAKKHGFDKLMRLLELFAKNESGEAIAEEFGFTRQRCHQLRHKLGITKFIYITSPEVLEFIKFSSKL